MISFCIRVVFDIICSIPCTAVTITMFACPSAGRLGCVEGRCFGTHMTSPRMTVVRRGYQVDVDNQPRSSPDSAPGRWGAGPPPPPPPPPPKQPATAGAPSRREALFGLLGAGLGVGVTTAYYKAQYPDDDASLAEALDELLDNPDFLDAVADELLYQEYEAGNDENNAALSRMRNALMAESEQAKQAEGNK